MATTITEVNSNGMKRIKRIGLTIVYMLLLGAACRVVMAAETPNTDNPFEGIQTNLVYMQSFRSGDAAGAVAVSIPVIRVNKPVIGQGIVINADAIALADNDKTRLALGGSATIKGLDTGDISLGLAYVPSGNMGWTGYIRITPIKF